MKPICKTCKNSFNSRNDSMNIFCSKSCSAKYGNALRRIKSIEKYNPNPKHCIECNSTLDYDQRKNKFCSHTCAANSSNRTRSPESYKKQAETLLANKMASGWVRKTPIAVPRKINTRICSICNITETSTGRFQSNKCKFCNDSLTYRHACKFTFDIKKYPDEFEIDLLVKHGMFNPRTNSKGVSKDHMLSVNYGKENRIDPAILSHPANCKLMLQGDNTRKNKSNTITYEDLLHRIDQWNKKYQ